MFYGIIIYMYKKEHMPPHIHAKYQGREASFDFNGKRLDGKLKKTKERLVKAWIEIHKDELKANWELLQSGEEICRIDPLK